jgi:peptidoglycan/LPS O-acetylase OafA/YrhL
MNHVNMRLRGAKIPYTHGLPDQLVSSLVWNGQQGVQIFFAVSGFLITTTALHRWGSGIDIRGFYRLRFARIAPLLLALLVILSGLHLAQVQNFVISSKTGGLARALLAALTFHVNVLEARRGYLPANWDILWSLSVEEVFYFFFPLVRRNAKLFVGLLLTCIVLGPYSRTHGNGVWREYSYLGGMDAIAMGCLTALLVARFRCPPRILVAAGSLLMIFCLCFSLTLERWRLEHTGLSMSILAVGACLIIAASAQTRWKESADFKPVTGTRAAQLRSVPNAHVRRLRFLPVVSDSRKADEGSAGALRRDDSGIRPPRRGRSALLLRTHESPPAKVE